MRAASLRAKRDGIKSYIPSSQYFPPVVRELTHPASWHRQYLVQPRRLHPPVLSTPDSPLSTEPRKHAGADSSNTTFRKTYYELIPFCSSKKKTSSLATRGCLSVLTYSLFVDTGLSTLCFPISSVFHGFNPPSLDSLVYAAAHRSSSSLQSVSVWSATLGV